MERKKKKRKKQCAPLHAKFVSFFFLSTSHIFPTFPFIFIRVRIFLVASHSLAVWARARVPLHMPWNWVVYIVDGGCKKNFLFILVYQLLGRLLAFYTSYAFPTQPGKKKKRDGIDFCTFLVRSPPLINSTTAISAHRLRFGRLLFINEINIVQFSKLHCASTFIYW